MSKLSLKEIDEEIQKELIEKGKKEKLKALKEGKIIKK
jgi:hypothetical protein